MSLDTVGTLLAAIANLLHEGILLLNQTDKTLWGADEHEQLRALEDALDEAKKDFQELSPLVRGQLYYQNDRTSESRTPARSSLPLACTIQADTCARSHPQPSPSKSCTASTLTSITTPKTSATGPLPADP